MRFLRGRPGGFYGTAAVAGVLATMGVLATPWAGLFHMGWPGGLATVAATLVIAAGLLRRWRPLRAVVLTASGISVVTATAVGLLSGQPGPLIMAAGSAANLLILLSPPVKEYFEEPLTREDTPVPPQMAAEPAALPPEKVETAVGPASQRAPAESCDRVARSNRSPAERK